MVHMLLLTRAGKNKKSVRERARERKNESERETYIKLMNRKTNIASYMCTQKKP